MTGLRTDENLTGSRLELQETSPDSRSDGVKLVSAHFKAASCCVSRKLGDVGVFTRQRSADPTDPPQLSHQPSSRVLHASHMTRHVLQRMGANIPALINR